MVEGRREREGGRGGEGVKGTSWLGEYQEIECGGGVSEGRRRRSGGPGKGSF